MPRKGEYLFKRPGSQNWWLRFQYPEAMAKPKVQISLGTPDKGLAEIDALPHIFEHKRTLLFGRWLHGKPRHLIEPGTESVIEGARVLATAEELVTFDGFGRVADIKPNKDISHMTLTVPPLPAQRRAVAEMEPIRRKVRGADKDAAILETWIKHRDIDQRVARDARGVFALFKELVGGKHFAACARDDGRKLSEHLYGLGLKSATVTKKVGFLNSAVNIAIDEGKLKFNPFSKVVAAVKDEKVRLPLDDDDMAAMRAVLPELDDEHRLLWIWLATTGMRLSEPFQVSEEFSAQGVRFVIVGTKSESSERRVPIPDAVIPLLPAKIKGPLFSDTPRKWAGGSTASCAVSASLTPARCCIRFGTGRRIGCVKSTIACWMANMS
jgi:integrase